MTGNTPLTLGVEEEVFITEPDRPSLQSLYYLARLLWLDPRHYYTHSASNFARGKDIGQGLMSGVEIATSPHTTPDAVVSELGRRRRELASVSAGLIVPLGHLLDRETPTNTCGLHVHIGGVPDPEKAYRNLVHFLPLLVSMTLNSPVAGSWRNGLSYRFANSFAIGPLREDREYRFQDMIISKRLGTIEIRAFDPFWDLERLRHLLRCIAAIASHHGVFPGDIETYNRLRPFVAMRGYSGALRRLYKELNRICKVPESLFLRPPAIETRSLVRRGDTVGAYAALDNAYRTGLLAPREPPRIRQNPVKVLAGIFGYYLPKAPYVLLKARQEW